MNQPELPIDPPNEDRLTAEERQAMAEDEGCKRYHLQQEAEEMTDLNLLKRSCVRLPRLIELNAPANIILNEIRHLSKFAFHFLGEAMAREVHSRLEEQRKSNPRSEK